jgi:hypothetical protein
VEEFPECKGILGFMVYNILICREANAAVLPWWWTPQSKTCRRTQEASPTPSVAQYVHDIDDAIGIIPLCYGPLHLHTARTTMCTRNSHPTTWNVTSTSVPSRSMCLRGPGRWQLRRCRRGVLQLMWHEHGDLAPDCDAVVVGEAPQQS